MEEFTTLTSLHARKVNLQDSIFQIIYLIQTKNDYESAADLFNKHTLSISQLREYASTLSDIEIVKFADEIIRVKG